MFKCTKCGKEINISSDQQTTNCPFDGNLMVRIDKNNEAVNEGNQVYILNE